MKNLLIKMVLDESDILRGIRLYLQLLPERRGFITSVEYDYTNNKEYECETKEPECIGIQIPEYNVDKLSFFKNLIGEHRDTVMHFIDVIQQVPQQTLKFIGNGSWYNQSSPNTSAYLNIDDSTMILIDCGESIYREIVNNNILDGVKHLYIYITHNHSDHIGSLSSLVLRCKYVWDIDVEVITHHDNASALQEILDAMGCDCEVNGVITKFIYTANASIRLDAFRVNHVDCMVCSGLFIRMGEKRLLYTGDICDYIGQYIDLDKYDEIYTDCSTSYKSKVHVHLDTLDELVDTKLRHKIFCMHIDGDQSEILQKGFNCTTTIM